ncbi:hypothetical protein AWN68_12775 [Roseivirga echinicomitans]|uniref:Uncharacterized protein n=1 Tax=Roseivirga echinicomitans TaxID=296218 RepID=A0A150XV91_9BACT|nr:hypothetical protein AWN68_12775 [Roseivirga echinicomitans]
MFDLILFLLGILGWLKLITHYKYYRELTGKNYDKDFGKFIYNKLDKESFGDVLSTSLKFILPIFKKEFLDIGEDNYYIYRKRVYIILAVWWITFSILIVYHTNVLKYLTFFFQGLTT